MGSHTCSSSPTGEIQVEVKAVSLAGEGMGTAGLT